jgi:hypothetical protein
MKHTTQINPNQLTTTFTQKQGKGVYIIQHDKHILCETTRGKLTETQIELLFSIVRQQYITIQELKERLILLEEYSITLEPIEDEIRTTHHD